jgi:hypothetical protein
MEINYKTMRLLQLVGSHICCSHRFSQLLRWEKPKTIENIKCPFVQHHVLQRFTNDDIPRVKKNNKVLFFLMTEITKDNVFILKYILN